jgi:hypothetical protein
MLEVSKAAVLLNEMKRAKVDVVGDAVFKYVKCGIAGGLGATTTWHDNTTTPTQPRRLPDNLSERIVRDNWHR